jgi:hypothetical protein
MTENILRVNQALLQAKKDWDATFDAGKENKALRQKVFVLAEELKKLLLQEECSKQVVDLQTYKEML